jgi:hypothetical protein
MDCSPVVRLYGAQAAGLEKVRCVEIAAVMVWTEGGYNLPEKFPWRLATGPSMTTRFVPNYYVRGYHI